MQADYMRKIWLFAGLLVRRPLEAYDRLVTVVEVKTDRLFAKRPHYETLTMSQAFKTLEEHFGRDSSTVISDFDALKTRYLQHDLEVEGHSVAFSYAHDADLTLAAMSYLLCRWLRPEVVLETGVAHGITSATILAAQSANENGRLYSIDLPPLTKNADRYVGIRIPQDLRSRWTLIRGTSKRVLPNLTTQLETVHLFVHDSLHTYRHILFELRTVFPLLARPAAVIVDDVENNCAFIEWIHEVKPDEWFVVQEATKKGAFGVALFLGSTSTA